MTVWLELAIVIGLILLNGFFAMAEMAIVSSRRLRLQQMAEDGQAGANRALALSENPGKFLSSVQVGITLIGTLSGAFGGATIGNRLGLVLDEWPLIAPHGHEVAFASVVIIITALSVIVGELAPKRLALASPERIAARVARPLEIVAGIGRPFAWFFDRSTALVLVLFGVRERANHSITEEEVKIAISEGTEAGVIEEAEEKMIHGVLALADMSVNAVMTPRPNVYWIDLSDPSEQIAKEILESPFSRLVVARGGDISQPVGVLQKKDLIGDLLAGRGIDVERHLVQPLAVPETVSTLRLLELFRSSGMHIGFVVDEYGDFLGLVTLADVMRAVAGELPEANEPNSVMLTERQDGSWLVDGRTSIVELSQRLDLEISSDANFHTAAGLALEQLARIPTEGDAFNAEGWRVEIVDMDGNRVDKLLFSPREGE